VAELSGVSLPMYALITLSNGLWTVYGLLIGDILLVITNVLVAPCALFVALKAWRSQSAPMVVAAEVV
jgi:uncharacterized protein with PQ loop repeat